MSIELYLAPAAAGKTEFCLRLARETAVSQSHTIYVCVPSSLQASAWRARLAVSGGVLGVEVVTFDELVARCLQQARLHHTELTRAVRYRLLRALVDRLPLQHYAPLRGKPGFIQVVEQLIAELKSAQIDPDSFRDGVAAVGNEPRLAELALIYARYQSQLQQEQWVDRVGRQWLAAELLGDDEQPVGRNWPLLIVDGFDDFEPIQLIFLRRLAARTGRLVMTLPWRERGELPRYQRTRQQVEGALGVTGLPLPFTPPENRPLAVLATRLFLERTEPAPVAAPHLTLVELPDRAAEVRLVLRWLKKRILLDGVSPGETAVIARDIVPYRPYLEQVAAEFGLPLYLPEGIPLDQSPIIVALLDLLRLFLPDPESGLPLLPRRQMIATWRSPYFSWRFEDMEITAADADLLDAFARQQRVIGGLDQWREAFAIIRDAAEMDNEHELDSEEAAVASFSRARLVELERKLLAFMKCCQPPMENQTSRAFVRWLEGLIGPDPQVESRFGDPDEGEGASLQMVAQARQHTATAEVDVAALRRLKEILKGMVWAETAVAPTQTQRFGLFFQELLSALSGATVEVPPVEPAILAVGISQAGGLRFAAAALLGLSEGEFPAALMEDPFLRDRDRREISLQLDLSLRPSTQSSEKAYFYEAVTRADNWLCVTRPVLADNGADWVASPYWEELAAWSTTTNGQQEGELALEEAASPVEWWTRAAAHPQIAAALSAEQAVAWKQIEHGAAVWRARLLRRPSPWDGDLSALAPALSRRFNAAHVWSTSRLETYQTCGYFFYVQNVLQLQPRPEPAAGLDARQLGTVYHEILEKVVATVNSEATGEQDMRQIVYQVAAPLLQQAPAVHGFRETAWWPQTRQEILENVTRTVQELAGSVFAFLAAEASFGFDGPPLEIRFGDDALRLRGFIDRVDRREDGAIRVIDYKTSGKSPYSSRAFAEGKKLQLPLYALAAQELLQLGPVAEGFYWHLHQADASPFQLSKVDGGPPAAMETAVAAAWEAVQRVRGGVFSPSPPAGGCPTYCPAAAFCWHYQEGYR